MNSEGEKRKSAIYMQVLKVVKEGGETLEKKN